MTTDDVIELLDEIEVVTESYVTVREMKLWLDFGEFTPRINVRICKSSSLPPEPYFFEVSHYVHTPVQIGPYLTSRTNSATEEEAIRNAITTTKSFIEAAIREGHEPGDEWLVANQDY